MEAEQLPTYDPESLPIKSRPAIGGRKPPVSDDVIKMAKTPASRATYRNFLLVAIFVSINYGCSGSNISVSVARFGETGAWQSGAFFLALTLSAMAGATYVVKKYGSKHSMVIGLALLCFYSLGTTVYTALEEVAKPVAIGGAAIAGIGAGILWTSQGVYFSQSADQFAREQEIPVEYATSMLAGTFGFIFLTCEMLMRLLSTVILSVNPDFQWEIIFAIYTVLAVSTVIGMTWAYEYPITSTQEQALFKKLEAVFYLLVEDPKMKYLIPFSLALGFGNAFVNSFINGEVLEIALNDENNRFVGLFSAFNSAIAAIFSLMFASWWPDRKHLFVILGGCGCIGTALPFLFLPHQSQYGWGALFGIHAAWGVARTSYECAYKAAFADFFQQEREGAFASLVLQNSLASSIGFTASYSVLCGSESRYCVLFGDGQYHNVLTMTLFVILTTIVGLVCYWYANMLYMREKLTKQKLVRGKIAAGQMS